MACNTCFEKFLGFDHGPVVFHSCGVGQRRTDKGDTAKCPVFDLHKVFSTEEERAWAIEGCTTAGIGCIDCKKVLIAHVMELMEPIWEKRERLKANPDILKDAVDKGVAKATKVCEETMQDVRKHMGF